MSGAERKLEKNILQNESEKKQLKINCKKGSIAVRETMSPRFKLYTRDTKTKQV